MKDGIEEMYQFGLELGRALGVKKSQTIVFRLLNIVRAGDWEKFVDSIIHLVAANREKISKNLDILINYFLEKSSKDHAHAFLLGMLANRGEMNE